MDPVIKDIYMCTLSFKDTSALARLSFFPKSLEFCFQINNGEGDGWVDVEMAFLSQDKAAIQTVIDMVSAKNFGLLVENLRRQHLLDVAMVDELIKRQRAQDAEDRRQNFFQSVLDEWQKVRRAKKS